MKRFEYNANDVDTAIHYLKNRAVQLLSNDFFWSGNIKLLKNKNNIWGVETTFTKEKEIYYSIYTLAGSRGNGYTKNHLLNHSKLNNKFITVPDCNVFNFLNRYVNTTLTCNHQLWDEYKYIENYYKNNITNRSKQYLMNHIDEGIAILNSINATENSIKAFMLHPMIQNDDALYNNLDFLVSSKLNRYVMSYALEYRNIANSYLSPMELHPGYKDFNKIKLSPLKNVNDMLIADKIQNRKDFEIYHIKTHDKSAWLQVYFKQWLNRLNIKEECYNFYKERLSTPIIRIINE